MACPAGSGCTMAPFGPVGVRVGVRGMGVWCVWAFQRPLTSAHPGLIVTAGWHVKALWATVRLLEPYLGISGVNTGTDLLSKMPNVDLERGAAALGTVAGG